MKLSSFLAVFLILSFLGLLVTGYTRDSTQPSGPRNTDQTEQQPDPSHFRNYFRKQESPIEYSLTYGWTDYRNQSHRLEFFLSKLSVRESEREFGYNLTDLNLHLDETVLGLRREMIMELETFTRRLISQSRYSEYISVEKSRPDSLDFKLKVEAPPELNKKVKKEFDKITLKISKEQKDWLKQIKEARDRAQTVYLNERGVRYYGDKLGVDYGTSVKRNRERIRHFLEALLKDAGDMNIHQFMEHSLAFIQEIRYGLPPLQENGKFIFEFWPPPKVLVNNLGDCDSKSVTFASVWTLHRRFPLLLIRVPNHMFVGLAIPSYSEQGVVINGLRYTLCEVAGPEKFPPGMLSPYSRRYLETGGYYYEMIR